MCQGERLAPLRSSVAPDDPSSAQQANARVLRARNLRLASLGLWTLLWLECAASDADLRPSQGLKRYEDFIRLAEGYLMGRVPRPT